MIGYSGSARLISASKVGPLGGAPEVVDHQQPAGQQVVAQPVHLRLGHIHVADLERIEEREPTEVRVVESDGVLHLVRIDVDQSVDMSIRR